MVHPLKAHPYYLMWNQKEWGGSREGGGGRRISDTSTLIDGSEVSPPYRTNTSTTTVEEVGTVAVKTGRTSIPPAAAACL